MWAAIPETTRYEQPMVWTQTQSADGNTALRLQSHHSANTSPSCLHLLSGRVRGAWTAPVAVASGGLFFPGPGPYDPFLPSFLPHLSHNWSACMLSRTVRLPRRVRERILCNLRLPWWLWGAQSLPPIPSHLTLIPTLVILELSVGGELCSDQGEGILS